MTIDERLEALAQSMELLSAMHLDNEKRYHERFAEIGKNFETVTHNFNVVLDSIKSLERIASAHETRISHLEGD
jgi:hypothetical protein